MDLQHCFVVMTSIEADGHKDERVRYFLTRKATAERDEQTEFRLSKNQKQSFPIIARDLKDKVSKPPFLLRLAGGEMPLEDRTHYRLGLELRSEYEFPAC